MTLAFLMVCFLTGSEPSWPYRLCVYDCLGSEVVQTIGIAEICNPSLEFDSEDIE